jgi:hypothetical protein
VATADVYVKQSSHTDAVMGQPAKDQINHLWISDNKFAMHSDDQSIIIDLDASKMYMIQHKSKSYVPMDLPLDLAKYFPPQMQQMMQGMSLKVNVTGEKETIGQWPCEIYEMTMTIMGMEMTQKIWASTEVPFDWKAFNERLMPQFMQAFMRLGADSLDEFKKIQGFQIKTEMSMNMMGNTMKNTSDVLEIDSKSAPAGTYAPPAGYTKKDKLDFMDMR